jgi:renalase
VDSRAKGISEERILTIYATADFSKAYYDHGDDVILDEILSRLDLLLPNKFISGRQLKRWRYAQADHVYPHPFLQMSMSEAVFVSGDAFLHEEDETGKTRIESAVISGLSVADAMQQFLNGKAST